MNYALFRKPSRYIGNELNIVRKNGDIRVALCFPDTYEIGMSHLGLKILYEIINSIPDASAERVFAPWIDLEAYLRNNSLPLISLENRLPLKDFDIVGFTLQYELSYTNILNMLDLGNIPLDSRKRDAGHPLIIAGGPCAMNPMPLAPFIDAFVIGDGEDVIQEIIEVTSRAKKRPDSGGRADLLDALSELEGVYVPSVHDKTGQKVRKRLVADLDKAPYPDKPLVPYAKTVHDRVAIEVARGCTRGCRFCQAGMTYRPRRERSLATVLALSEKSIASTGYEEISFLSLSTGDYSCLFPLIQTLNNRYAGAHVAVSLPSLRVGSLSRDVLKEIKRVRKTGFTIAPEAGTARLRSVINKDITDEEYNETLTRLFSEGWTQVKLYFMTGLPTETMDDINGLIDMAIRTLKRGRELTGRRVTINVGVSSFVPKPHTPFQWIGQDSVQKLREKQDYIKKVFRKKGINFKGAHVEVSQLEAVFSRGGRECAPMLEKAWELGCRFDSWSEHFDFDKWTQAADMTGIDLSHYACRTFTPEEELPWDIIDTGVTKSFLLSECRKATEELITEDCRNNCHGCGLECKDKDQVSQQDVAAGEKNKSAVFSSKFSVPSRIRVKFSKTGEMRYLSHSELMTVLFRALRRSRIPVAYSSGFHPHPKVSFGPALPSGVAGINEFFDIELTAVVNPQDMIQRMNSVLPEGIRLSSALIISKKDNSLGNIFKRYAYEVIIDNSLINSINSFLSRDSWEVQRKNKTVDIRPTVEGAQVEGNILKLFLADTEKANARLNEVLKELLQLSPEDVSALTITRVGLYGYNNDNKKNPREDGKLCQAK